MIPPLPTETLAQIFKYLHPFTLESTQDTRYSPAYLQAIRALSRLALSSRLFNDIATPLLYSDVDIDMDSESYLILLSTLSLRRDLGDRVLSLRVRRTSFAYRSPNCGGEMTEAVEKLLRKVTRLENLTVMRMSTLGNPELYSTDLLEEESVAWTEVFRLLANFSHFLSLRMISACTYFALPPLPSLTELHVDTLALSHTLSTSFPSLKSLTYFMIDYCGIESQYPAFIKSLAPRLHYLDLPGTSSPLAAARLLQFTPNLQTFKVSLVVSNNTGNLVTDLPDVQAITLPPLEIFEISLELKGIPFRPSDTFVEGMRSLLFSFRRCKMVKICFTSLMREADESEREEFLTLVRQVWRGEGTLVTVDDYTLS